MGEVKYKGKGVAITATKLLLEYAFSVLMLNKVYLFTEIDNIAAQKLFEKAGFIKEGCLKKDLFSNGKYVDRFCYGMCKEDYKGQ